MASFSRVLLVVLYLLLFFSFDFTTAAPSKKPSSSARREDIPFIKCQVCERIAHQIHSQVQKKEAQTGPKKVSEFEIIEIAENVCNLKKEQADWILQIDIVEKGDKLKLVDQETEGQCNSECKTIEHACQEVMGYADTDVAEFFFKTKPSVDSLVKFLCYDLSKACSVPPPPVPKDRIPGEPFLAKPSKDAEMEKILRSMNDMPGAPSMKMYSREDLLNNNFGGEDVDEDEDEDDFPTKLGEALKHKGPSNQDLKGKLLKGIKETGKRMKQHLSKVSQTVKKWWRGKKSSPKSKKSSKAEL